jgi:hypothetical protein
MNDRLSPMSNYSPPQPINPEHVNRELERILRSQAFRNAPLLQRFLAYVIQKALEGRAEDIKEYSIATEVLNRSSDFDPKTSPLVRVEARRLRERLSQYYASEGAGDAIVFDIPRGGYVPTFVYQRELASLESLRLESPISSKEEIRPSDAEAKVVQKVSHAGRFSLIRRGALWRFGWLALGLFAMLGVVAFILFMSHPRVTSRPSEASLQSRHDLALKPDALVLMLWSNLLGNARTAYVFYHHHNVPMMSASKGLDEAKGGAPGTASPPASSGPAANRFNPPVVPEPLLSFDNTFTGVGEVQGVYALTRLLVRLGIPIEVHACQSLPKDAVATHTVILLGPDLERELRAFRPTQEDFVFDDFGPVKGPKRTRILNLHPLLGEQPFFETQQGPLEAETIVDWAILSVLPGIRQQRKTIVMAGLTHTGTEAVAEFCASGTGVVTLLNRLGAGENEKTLPTYYQVLLRVTIKQGTIIDIAYVAGRVIRSG